ncbi:MAG: hypothetical protein L6R28_11680 [Planctomycetes bacterium]|nr:hypothetical protein [Planctomycetota bacterium]
MSKSTIRSICTPLAMGLLLAAIGFSFSMATTPSGAGARLVPACTVPPPDFVTGHESSTSATCFDLGTVVVNREFTRIINVRDGTPPFTFSILTGTVPRPQNSVLTLSSAGQSSILLTGTFRGRSPDDGACLPHEGGPNVPPAAPDDYHVFELEVEETLSGTIDTQFFCIRLEEITDVNTEIGNTSGDEFIIEDLTNVAPVIDPLGFGSPVPPAPFLGTSDGVSFNDLPNALQRQPYNYQLHINGGFRTGGDLITPLDYTPSDDLTLFNHAGAIAPDTTSVFSGLSDGTYTFEVADVDSDGVFDLLVSSDVDPGLTGSTTQTFNDVMGAGGVVPGGAVLCIGSLGVRMNTAAPPIPGGTDPVDTVKIGDVWVMDVTAFEPPDIIFSLHPDSTDMPPGLSLSEDGLVSGTPDIAGDYTFIVIAQQVERTDDPDTGEEIITVLKEAVRQIFLRVDPGPINSQFVLTKGQVTFDFGHADSDTMRLNLLLAKDLLRDFSQLEGATFDLEIGANNDRIVLSSLLTEGPLTFGPQGSIDYPPQLAIGDEPGKYASDPNILVKPLNPNLGGLNLFISNISLKKAMDAASLGASGIMVVPISIVITGIQTDSGPLDLRLDELVSFAFKKRSLGASSTMPKGFAGATAGVGQFIIAPANGSIIFDPTTGSDTLSMTLKGFLRDNVPIAPLLTPGNPVPTTLADTRMDVLLGLQCGMSTLMEGGGVAPFTTIKNTTSANGLGGKLIITCTDPDVPVALFALNKATGAFVMKLRSPATNAGLIAGLVPPDSLVLDVDDPFVLTVRIRLYQESDNTNVVIDATYSLVLFRKGRKLNLK